MHSEVLARLDGISRRLERVEALSASNAAPPVVDLTAGASVMPEPTRKRSGLALVARERAQGDGARKKVKIEREVAEKAREAAELQKAGAEKEREAAEEARGAAEKGKEAAAQSQAAAEDSLEDAQDLNRDLSLFQDQKMSEIDALKRQVRELQARLDGRP
ncbi:hypothetical protein TeGR_g911 [Tetraparma gracilis]|uniref:Uncharacterized protein n=1 Tax=Tetraparma gracilis TaxID=2962635 RepID=A0ABQ6MX22_9STRA|nr:hypothetical protein TeGR_g911 [Tetraparma gracilis]